MDKRGLVFICAHCGNISYSEEDSIDSGTSLTCSKCGKKTVVELFTLEAYLKRHKQVQKNSLSKQ
jgi:DNA-directed RNA polymerase subunit RPC12/RpoP